MNGYKIMAESYRKFLEQEPDKLDKDIAEKSIRAYEYLADCSEEDLCILIDSGAFNNIIGAFLKVTMKNIGLDRKTENRARAELEDIFDMKTCMEVLDEGAKNE